MVSWNKGNKKVFCVNCLLLVYHAALLCCVVFMMYHLLFDSVELNQLQVKFCHTHFRALVLKLIPVCKQW